MRTAIVYCFPTVDPAKYVPAAKKFVSSYLQFPGSLEEPELHVMVNCEQAVNLDSAKPIFEPLSPIFHQHNNYAKDLGAFLMAANVIEADMLVCLGAQIRFIRCGWLDRIIDSYCQTGPCVMGPWGFQEPRCHLRTTFFAIPPELLRSYPHDLIDRYAAEHGWDNITLWSQRLGFEPRQVTVNGTYSMKHFHPVTRQETLAWDQHLDRDLGEP